MTPAHHSKKRLAFTTIAVLVLAFLAVSGFLREYIRSLDTKREIAQLEQENAKLVAERDGAKSLINQLSSEYYLEAQARKQGYAKPGETMVVLDGEEAEGSVAEQSVGEGLSNPELWFLYLFDPTRFAQLKKV